MSRQLTLGDVVVGLEAGKSFQTTDILARDDELGVLKVSAVTWSAFRPDQAKAVVGYEPDDRHRVRRDDLLISRANTRELVGAVVLVERDYPFRLLSDKTLRLIVDTKLAEKAYLLYALRSKLARKHIEHLATGTSDSMRNIAQGVITSIPIALPQIVEQRRIASSLKSQLESVEEAHHVAVKQVSETVALRVAIYREAFCGVVPIAVTSDFECAPTDWHWTKLTDVARIESGHTPSRSRPDWWGGDISWVSLTEIRALDGLWVAETKIKTNSAGVANSAARVLPRGTVCFSRTASVGFVAIMAKPMATSQDFANWVCGDAIDPEFLMHALIRSRTELRALATGATHKTIYMPTLQAFHVCLPDRCTQEQIVARLKAQLGAVEQMRQAATAQLEEITRLPARLLARAFDHQGEQDHD